MDLIYYGRGAFYISSRRYGRAGARHAAPADIAANNTQEVVSSIDITAKRPPNDYSGKCLEKH